jgi:hypothetical protein
MLLMKIMRWEPQWSHRSVCQSSENWGTFFCSQILQSDLTIKTPPTEQQEGMGVWFSLTPPCEGGEGQEIDGHCRIIDSHCKISDSLPDLHTLISQYRVSILAVQWVSPVEPGLQCCASKAGKRANSPFFLLCWELSLFCALFFLRSFFLCTLF